MAKMKPQIDSTIVETQNEIQENPANMDLSAILARLDEQDKLIKELKKDWDENLKKEIYKWPRKYSFKIFDWKPILTYKSFKKDNTRDWKFKTLQGQEVINHWLTLSLWDFNENKIVSLEVSYDNFNDWFTYSEKMFCDVKSDWNETTWYEFTTVDFWKFTVLPNSIN